MIIPSREDWVSLAKIRLKFERRSLFLFLLLFTAEQFCGVPLAHADPDGECSSVCQNVPTDERLHPEAADLTPVNAAPEDSSGGTPPPTSVPFAGTSPVPTKALNSYCQTYHASDDTSIMQGINLSLDTIAAAVCGVSCAFLMSTPEVDLGTAEATKMVKACAWAGTTANVAEIASIVAMQKDTLFNGAGSSADQAAAWLGLLGTIAGTVSGAAPLTALSAGGKATMMFGAGAGMAALGGGGRIAATQKTNPQASGSPTAEEQKSQTLQNSMTGSNSQVLDAIVLAKVGMLGVRGLALQGAKRGGDALITMKRLPGVNACISTALYTILAGLRMSSFAINVNIGNRACDSIRCLSHKCVCPDSQCVTENESIWNGLDKTNPWLKYFQMVPPAQASLPTRSLDQALLACDQNQSTCLMSKPAFSKSFDGELLVSSGMADRVLPIAADLGLDAMGKNLGAGSFFAAIVEKTELGSRADLEGLKISLASLAQYASDHAPEFSRLGGGLAIEKEVFAANPQKNTEISEELLTYVGGLPWTSFGGRAQIGSTSRETYYHPGTDLNLFQIVGLRIAHTCKARLLIQNCPSN